MSIAGRSPIAKPTLLQRKRDVEADDATANHLSCFWACHATSIIVYDF